MKIERVDDKTVKCFLSNAELEEYEIDYKDFVTRSDKAREIVQEIIELAAEEVGYTPPKFAFDLQIMMMPEQGLVLTLSEKDPVELTDKDQIMAYLKELNNIFQASKGQFDKTEPEVVITPPDVVQNLFRKDTQRYRPRQIIFRVDSMADLFAFAAVIPDDILYIRSALYMMDGEYYLSLHKGGDSYNRLGKICIQATEFAEFYTADVKKILHMEELADCLIAEDALYKLKF